MYLKSKYLIWFLWLGIACSCNNKITSKLNEYEKKVVGTWKDDIKHVLRGIPKEAYKETLEAVGENNQYIYTSDKRFVFIIKDKKREGSWRIVREGLYWRLFLKYDDRKEEEACLTIRELTNEILSTNLCNEGSGGKYIRVK